MIRLFPRRTAGIHSLLLAMLLYVAASPLLAQSLRLQPNPAIASFGSPENHETADLLEAALYFSSNAAANPASSATDRTAQTRDFMLIAMEDARMLIDSEPDEYKRGEAILALLHSRFLRRYSEYETTIDAAVLEGRYNCVSSAVLFLLLAREAGLDTRGVSTKDHAFCAVTLSGGIIVDVETTNPQGWDPGSKKEFHDSFGKITGYSYVPPSNYKARTELQGRELVILIARNRATILERLGKWSQAVALAVDAYAYWPSEESRELLVDRINNYVADLARREAWEEALPILESAISLYGNHAKLSKLLTTAKLAILGGILKEGDTERSLAAVQKAEAEGYLQAKDRSDMLMFLFTKQAELARKTGGWLSAWSTLAQSASSYPDIAGLAKAAELSRVNWTYDVHNKFANLFNAKRFAEALAVLEEALRILPSEKLFLDDKKATLAAMQ